MGAKCRWVRAFAPKSSAFFNEAPPLNDKFAELNAFIAYTTSTGISLSPESHFRNQIHITMHNRLFTGLIAALPCITATVQAQDRFTVYLFLLEDCKITQAYTDRLAEMHATYACDSIAFVGLFPNPLSSDTTAAAFQRRYAIPFPCTAWQAAELADSFAVRVTPEVVLFNQTTGAVLYQGRIDNLFERVGKRRRIVTAHELESALESVRRHKEIRVTHTQAVGCLLPRRKTDNE